MLLKSMKVRAEDRDSGFSLQDEVMRFEGRFSSRLVSAFAPLVDSNDPAVRLRAADDELKFMSAALDIAVGAAPEINLLDMVTLVALGREVTARRWSADVYGPAAEGLAKAFQASLDDITAIARNVTSDEVEAELRKVLEEWKAENPNQEDVSSVRLSAYAESVSSRGSRSASGLFSAVRGAARTADSAVLLAERALYAAQRLPFLVRTHARIGGSELFADLTRNIDALDVPGASQNAASNVRVLGGRLERSVDRLLLKAVVACGSVAVVAAASWLVARLTYHRLTTGW